MPPHKSKDAQKVLVFDITTHTKGFIAETNVDGNTTKQYFQYNHIQEIILHSGVGVEIVEQNQKRRVFYNDEVGKASELFVAINATMLIWMDSNLN